MKTRIIAIIAAALMLGGIAGTITVAAFADDDKAEPKSSCPTIGKQAEVRTNAAGQTFADRYYMGGERPEFVAWGDKGYVKTDDWLPKLDANCSPVSDAAAVFDKNGEHRIPLYDFNGKVIGTVVTATAGDAEK